MSVPRFDYDASWRGSEPTAWEAKGLHWHCHSSRMDGQEYGNESARQDLSTGYAPKLLRDWLRKAARTIRHVATTPEDGCSVAAVAVGARQGPERRGARGP
ncbi:hypothetical protein [Actinomadura kijaniata]|uniref:hypothetical protein n=1 Tax=Actinomadura kijaniata TaxID=46161 RepID=UPI000A8E5651|nr:hypothetical protein [Actinomadura kijaniata]